MAEVSIIDDFPETYSGCTVFLPAQQYDVAGCLGHHHADGDDTDSGAYVQVAIYAGNAALPARGDHLQECMNRGSRQSVLR